MKQNACCVMYVTYIKQKQQQGKILITIIYISMFTISFRLHIVYLIFYFCFVSMQLPEVHLKHVLCELRYVYIIQ